MRVLIATGVAVAAVLGGCGGGAAFADTLLPSDRRITYIGRFQGAPSSMAAANITLNKEVKHFGWAGVQIACRFKGTSVSAQLQGAPGVFRNRKPGRFLAIVDGQPQTAFVTKAGSMREYVLAEGLEDGEHEVVLWKISEDLIFQELQGVDAFGGFSADEFLDAPAPKKRRLEFIGDSDTAGWCADGTADQANPYTLENTYQTWAAQLARNLDADFLAEALSGIGAYTAKAGGHIIQDVLPNTLPFYNGDSWDVSWQQTPDAVVMLIGPNDQGPNSDGFKMAYRQLMEDVVSMYAQTSKAPKIINVCGGSINGFDPCNSIQEVNNEFNSGRSDGFKGYYTSISEDTWNTINTNTTYLGCDKHYGPKGHEAFVSDILPQVRDIMGWSSHVVV